MSTTFWNLCSDIYLEIFRYFSVDQLFYSFYPDVLVNLFEILLESRINLQLHLTDDDFLTTTLLSLINHNQIISLHLPLVNIVLTHFSQIQSITLTNVDDNNIHLTQLSQLPLLERLTLIYSRDQLHLSKQSLEDVFHLPSLKYLKLDFKAGYLNFPVVSVPLCCRIEQLILRTPCSWMSLRALIVNLSSLRVLRIMTDVCRSFRINGWSLFQNFPPAIPSVYLLSLQTVDLVWYSIKLNDIILFLREMPNVKNVYLTGNMQPENLQSKIWRIFISDGCPNVKKFKVNILIWVQEGAEQVKRNFDEDKYFSQINFILLQSTTESELLKLYGDFRR